MKLSIRHLGPSMIQQVQHVCNECKGTGETISDRDRCTQCKGEKVVQEKKVLEVVVEKGMQNGQKITFPGEADESVCIAIEYKICIQTLNWIMGLRLTLSFVFCSLIQSLGILYLSCNRRNIQSSKERLKTFLSSILCLSPRLYVVSSLCWLTWMVDNSLSNQTLGRLSSLVCKL